MLCVADLLIVGGEVMCFGVWLLFSGWWTFWCACFMTVVALDWCNIWLLFMLFCLLLVILCVSVVVVAVYLILLMFSSVIEIACLVLLGVV